MYIRRHFEKYWLYVVIDHCIYNNGVCKIIPLKLCMYLKFHIILRTSHWHCNLSIIVIFLLEHTFIWSRVCTGVDAKACTITNNNCTCVGMEILHVPTLGTFCNVYWTLLMRHNNYIQRLDPYNLSFYTFTARNALSERS